MGLFLSRLECFAATTYDERCLPINSYSAGLPDGTTQYSWMNREKENSSMIILTQFVKYKFRWIIKSNTSRPVHTFIFYTFVQFFSLFSSFACVIPSNLSMIKILSGMYDEVALDKNFCPNKMTLFSYPSLSSFLPISIYGKYIMKIECIIRYCFTLLWSKDILQPHNL